MTTQTKALNEYVQMVQFILLWKGVHFLVFLNIYLGREKYKKETYILIHQLLNWQAKPES